AATANSIDVRSRGAVLTFPTNAASQVELEGIPVTTRSVLVGRTVRVVFEPGSLTLLRMGASAQTATGTVQTVDATGRLVTISGRTPRTFIVDASATILRDGAPVTLTTLAAGDRVRVAFVKQGTGFNALALSATPVVVSPPAARRR
ncbi:MAG TPA: hypothetical protein VFU47_16435, partial [Armatimonadota bacterium]|nr:hypothetical protein [Armatimonadota bacterium]